MPTRLPADTAIHHRGQLSWAHNLALVLSSERPCAPSASDPSAPALRRSGRCSMPIWVSGLPRGGGGIDPLVLSCLIGLATWIYNFNQEIKSDQHWALWNNNNNTTTKPYGRPHTLIEDPMARAIGGGCASASTWKGKNVERAKEGKCSPTLELERMGTEQRKRTDACTPRSAKSRRCS